MIYKKYRGKLVYEKKRRNIAITTSAGTTVFSRGNFRQKLKRCLGVKATVLSLRVCISHCSF